MSSAKKSHQTSKSVSSTPPTDDHTSLASKPPSSAENAMDQPLDSTVIAVPPAPPIPSETMSSTDSPSTDVPPTPPTPPSSAAAPAPENGSLNLPALRQQPIPPASEPMQYRAIGLIRGKYQASDEQFTRGEIVTDDGVPIGAVLLGRVMSLVKKHLDLEQSHLWVVYPRTREKGDGNLHVQIVGVWEPENLNRVMEASEPEDETAEDEQTDAHSSEPIAENPADEAAVDTSSDALSDAPSDVSSTAAVPVEPAPEAALDPEAETIAADTAAGAETEATTADLPEPTAAPLPTAAEPDQATAPPDSVSSADVNLNAATDAAIATEAEAAIDTATDESTSENSSEHSSETASPVAADELDDRYFSVRGEVIYQSLEDNRLLVKIRRSPRPGVDEDKAFKVVLVGALEGKAVGYFWDLHVQREGNMLVVQEGTMIGAVPPQKRGKKPPFNKRRGGGGGGRRPPGAGGPPRKRWQNREGQQRPSRSGSDRPTPPQNRGENRSPSPRPIKRRNVDNPET
jgi:hypothetical protein